MTPMKLKDAVRLLESNGFILIRSNGHMIYGNGSVRIALAHQRIVTAGVARSLYKAIKEAKSEIEVKVYA
jgi:predicted RNA binding protein YcfA (HicA-like mRNA interferase family)